MEAPPFVCQKLAEHHPGLRLGWDGEKDKFGLLMIFRKRLATKVYYEYWNWRGPVFDKRGRPRPDWDSVVKTPMYLSDLTPEDVYSGRVLWLARQWTRPLLAEYYRDCRKKGQDLESFADDVAHQAGLDLYREGQRDGSGAPIVAKKFIEPTVNQTKLRDGGFDFQNKFVTEAPGGSWDRWANEDEGDPDDLGEVN